MSGQKWMGLVWLVSLLLVGCGAESSSSRGDVAARTVRVVTTTGMIADVVRNVGGERVEVVQLMAAGVDPHLYKASEGDVQRLSEADIIFYNGLHLEARMADVLERIGESGKRTVAVGEAVPEAERLAPPEFAGFYDPHIWMDVKLWMHTVGAVRDALVELDPTHAEVYRTQADRYSGELAELESYAQAQLATLPPDRRVLVTAHDAFNYFARGYSFEVFAPQGISTETEAGIEDIRRTIEVLVERDVPSLFMESTISTGCG